MQRPGGPTQQTFTPAFPCLTFDSALAEVSAEFELQDVIPAPDEEIEPMDSTVLFRMEMLAPCQH